jgi:truncated hemoglobin YjbI
MHWYVDFKDPPDEPQRTPSLFEWAGGLPALLRATRLFYGKHVPADPLLAPVFAQVAGDEPERLASWLAEAFGGPQGYRERYGDRTDVLDRTDGLSEEARRRWVALLLQSAREAGLPDDPAFRVALGSYLEWSTQAPERSEGPEVPVWTWDSSAGPPPPQPSEAPREPAPSQAEIVLPGPDQPVSFEQHVRPLFRERDRRSMQFAFDLWAADEVRAQAPGILERLRDGSMPCDGAWPADWVAVFERWMQGGMDP